MSYIAHCEGCSRDTDWIEGKCIECGQGPYHVSIPKLREEIITLREQRDKLLADAVFIVNEVNRNTPVIQGALRKAGNYARFPTSAYGFKSERILALAKEVEGENAKP